MEKLRLIVSLWFGTVVVGRCGDSWTTMSYRPSFVRLLDKFRHGQMSHVYFASLIITLSACRSQHCPTLPLSNFHRLRQLNGIGSQGRCRRACRLRLYSTETTMPNTSFVLPFMPYRRIHSHKSVTWHALAFTLPPTMWRWSTTIILMVKTIKRSINRTRMVTIRLRAHHQKIRENATKSRKDSSSPLN